MDDKSKQRISSRTTAELEVKRARFIARVESDAVRSGQSRKFLSKIFEIIGGEPQEENLILASTYQDRVEQDPDKRIGNRVREGGRQGGSVGRERRAEERRFWQAHAEDIWSRFPSRSKSAVARVIAKKRGGNPNTIRQRIRRPEET